MFQKKVVEKYLSKIDLNLLREKYSVFCKIYKNEAKIKNIRSMKEEQYQEGFIRDLFCSVLGYTIKPEPNYNILTELKNETKNKNNARKSDGAICWENDETKVRAVIELKGTETANLDAVARQAFDYKSHHENCSYVIVSNFERLRLYIETQIDFEEFNLFSLDFERFKLLYLLLEIGNLKSDIPLNLKHETLTEEKAITDKFYADYSTFKRLLFEDMTENNPCKDKLVLFKKTQKLLDRILFILFCEDRGLLPLNSTLEIIKRWETSKENFIDVPLYSLFKQFFGWIDSGFTNPNDRTKSIFAYNGGLFKPDEILDGVKIGDDVLYILVKRLAGYDFESQISVDILGRIFENSLTEIEEIQNKIQNEKNGLASGLKTDLKAVNIGKRKKDGVFYTPEFITKYIVENTLGKLCEKKRTEMGISDEKIARLSSKKEKSEMNSLIHEYQKWLLKLKILDPACGSGAFLTAALAQLKREHKLCFDYLSLLNGDQMTFDEFNDNSILENNLYGVDINEESVEIAKLSLWLHTAKKNRKLTTLNGKIKCGNSLIDDPKVAGGKAFCWEKEFPEVFKKEDGQETLDACGKSGFDLVIGNPPYVNIKNVENNVNANVKEFYKSHYKSAKIMYDLYSLFTEKAHYLLKENGLFGCIFSNSWLGSQSFLSFREFLAKDVTVTELTDLPDKIFRDAAVRTVICLYENRKPNINDEIKITKCAGTQFFSKGFSLKYKEILENPNLSFYLEKKISLDKAKTVKLGDIAKFTAGISTANDKKFVLKEKIDGDCYLFLRGRDISRWKKPVPSGDYIWYKLELMSENVNARPRVKENFLVPQKILIQDVATEITATLDTKKFLCNKTINTLYDVNKDYDMKYILALLNSKFVNAYFKQMYPTGLHTEVSQLLNLPVPEISLDEQEPLISLADKMLSLNADFQKKSSNFLKVVKQTFSLEKASAKLENFYDLEFDGFIKELKKKVSPKEKLEWLDIFEETKAGLQEIMQKISETDRLINQIVYNLYGVTEEEINTVEKRDV